MTEEEYERRNENNVADPDKARRLALSALGYISGVAEGIAEEIAKGRVVTKNVLDQIDVVSSATIFLVQEWNSLSDKREATG